MIGRDEKRRTARRLETARGDWGKFIVRFCIDIIKVAVHPQLIIADLVLERPIASPAFLFRKRTREEVKVKARKYTPKASRAAAVPGAGTNGTGDIGACRG